MNIEVIELQPDKSGIDYVGSILMQPYILSAASEEQKSFSALMHIFDMFRIGYYRFFVPIEDGEPMGLVWGWMYSETQFLVHVSFLKEFWGNGTVTAGLEAEIMIRESTGCEEIIGLIPTDNRASHIYSLKCGFKCEEMKHGIFQRDGEDVPCWKMTKEV